MKFNFIEENRKEFQVRLMCVVLEISPAGYYAWRKRPESKRSQANKYLLNNIQVKFKQSRETYGYRRVHADLTESGETCGRNRVARLMKKHDIQPKSRKKFRVTTNSKHNKPIHANHLNRQFTASTPNQRWTSDITYIATQEGWLYLAVIMDLYSRKIIGWSMSERMKESLVVDALKMALFRRKVQANLLLHSDRGSQYASDCFQEVLRANNIECSMSRKGNCWDNAAMESFFHTLKTECVHHENYATREEAKKSIFDYIEIFYNRIRKHSFIGYRSPVQFELASGF